MKCFVQVCLVLIIVGLFSGCSSSTNGELVGVQGRKKYFEPDPYGMVFIELGSFLMGPSEQDVAWAQNVQSKTISVNAFWMDQTEITNNQYRQFVYYVRDSIKRRTLALAGHDDFLLSGESFDELPEEKRPLNWKTKIDVRKNDEHKEALEELYLKQEERFYGRRELDTRKLMYEFMWVDMKQAANPRNRYDYQKQEYSGYAFNEVGERVEVRDRSAFIMHERIQAYPDTLVWISDYSYSYNEPWATMYFWHRAYDNFPVVGVNWKQAVAFTIWRSRMLDEALAAQRDPFVHRYRLPSEFEWEYAARGGLANQKYPWGGPYTRNQQGCFLANFKPLRGNYADDGGVLTQRVASYAANEWGLYDMAGNVAEWTQSAYDESSYRFVHDLNPDYTYNARPDDPPVMKRKVVRGGSWKDVEYFLRVSTRTFEYQDSSSTTIGFRCVRDFLGNTQR